MKKVLFVFLSIWLLSSCVSNKYFYEHYSDLSCIDSSLIKLEGIYENKPINDIEDKNNYSSLEKIIFNPFHIYKWDEVRDFSGDIGIKVLSNNQIEICHILDGVILKRKVLKGKISNNYFEVNTRRKFLGVPLIYFKNDIEKLQLGISKDGNLIASNGRFHFGSIFIVFSYSYPNIPLSYFKRK